MGRKGKERGLEGWKEDRKEKRSKESGDLEGWTSEGRECRRKRRRRVKKGRTVGR